MDKNNAETSSLRASWNRAKARRVKANHSTRNLCRGMNFGLQPALFLMGTGVGEIALAMMGLQAVFEAGYAAIDKPIKSQKEEYVQKKPDGLYYAYTVTKPQKQFLDEIDRKLKAIVIELKNTKDAVDLQNKKKALEQFKKDVLTDPKLPKPKLVSPNDYQWSRRDYMNDMTL